MRIQELISEARDKNHHLLDSDKWHDAVEADILEMADTPEQGDDAIEQLNFQLFRAAGII